MIICISANPAIDRRLRIKDLKIGAVNRAVSVESFAGGKAAHVAMAAHALGEEVIWIGFLGGSTGDEIERQLNGLGIKTIAVCTKTSTRVNDEIIDENGQITEILEPGSGVSAEEIEQIFEVCRQTFTKFHSNFTAVLSGSLPPNVPPDFYAKLLLAAHEQDGKTILDTSGEAFLKGLEAKPGLIKPNLEEAEKALGLKIENEVNYSSINRQLAEMGAQNIALTLGEKGIVWLKGQSESTILAIPPKVEVISTVGCGDATVAGFAVAERRNLSKEQSLRLATACGAANCLAALPGQISRQDVEQLIPSVTLKSIEN